MTTQAREHISQFTLLPGESNAQGELPIPLIASRLIEVATAHSTSNNFGFAKLNESNQSWVLSRLAIEMKSYPHVYEQYTITTWIESVNRHFSERNFLISNHHGEAIGYARSIWVIIDKVTRESAPISVMDGIQQLISARPCPIDKQKRLGNLTEITRENSYQFRYTDIDINRHVNSARYIEFILNQWDLDFYDTHQIERFEITYQNEILCGNKATISIDESLENEIKSEITHKGEKVCNSRIKLKTINSNS
ncbi:MAG: thioesterase [Bacteroidales bacterium]